MVILQAYQFDIIKFIPWGNAVQYVCQTVLYGIQVALAVCSDECNSWVVCTLSHCTPYLGSTFIIAFLTYDYISLRKGCVGEFLEDPLDDKLVLFAEGYKWNQNGLSDRIFFSEYLIRKIL